MVMSSPSQLVTSLLFYGQTYKARFGQIYRTFTSRIQPVTQTYLDFAKVCS